MFGIVVWKGRVLSMSKTVRVSECPCNYIWLFLLKDVTIPTETFFVYLGQNLTSFTHFLNFISAMVQQW